MYLLLLAMNKICVSIVTKCMSFYSYGFLAGSTVKRKQLYKAEVEGRFASKQLDRPNNTLYTA